MTLGAELRAIETEVRTHRAGRERAVSDLLAFRLRRWATAVETRDRVALLAAFEALVAIDGTDLFDWQDRAIRAAVVVLCRAWKELEPEA